MSVATIEAAFPLRVQAVGVIGAGVIGSGVVQTSAEAGFRTILVDVSKAALERARDAISASGRLGRLFGGESHAVHETLSKIEFTTSHSKLSQADFIIENVTEDWQTKRGVYGVIEQVCNPGAVIAANTSAVPITRLSSLLSSPNRLVGIHFMNPVPMVKTVELIRGMHTSEPALAVARNLLKQLGKDWVEINDAPGFVSNRILMLAINEAVFALQEGVASAADIDKVCTGCFGHPMGLLETADLIGLDTVLLSLEQLYETLRDPKFRACPLLRQMVWAGWSGRKSGRGFFNYGME